MKYTEWVKNPTRFLSMTGYKIECFNELLPWFEEQHNIYYSKYDIYGKRKTGTRSYVLYANAALPSIEERLAFILSYKKLNPIQELHADLFGLTQKQCNSFIHSLTLVLELTLKAAEVMPATTEKELAEKLALIAASGGNIELIHDGTEREIPRPQDDE